MIAFSVLVEMVQTYGGKNKLSFGLLIYFLFAILFYNGIKIAKLARQFATQNDTVRYQIRFAKSDTADCNAMLMQIKK